MSHDEFIAKVAAMGYEPILGDYEIKWQHPNGETFVEDHIRELASNLGPGVYGETLKSLFRRSEKKKDDDEG